MLSTSWIVSTVYFSGQNILPLIFFPTEMESKPASLDLVLSIFCTDQNSGFFDVLYFYRVVSTIGQTFLIHDFNNYNPEKSEGFWFHNSRCLILIFMFEKCLLSSFPCNIIFPFLYTRFCYLLWNRADFLKVFLGIQFHVQRSSKCFWLECAGTGKSFILRFFFPDRSPESFHHIDEYVIF